MKAKLKVACAHRKVHNARADFLHRVSTRLVRQNDLIAIEDLNVAGMVRNRHLARAISGCGWGEFRRRLAYKCPAGNGRNPRPSGRGVVKGVHLIRRGGGSDIPAIPFQQGKIQAAP